MRPVLDFGYCRCLYLPVCVRVCVRHNSPSLQASIIKLGSGVKNYLVKISILLCITFSIHCTYSYTWACPDCSSVSTFCMQSDLGSQGYFGVQCRSCFQNSLDCIYSAVFVSFIDDSNRTTESVYIGNSTNIPPKLISWHTLTLPLDEVDKNHCSFINSHFECSTIV